MAAARPIAVIHNRYLESGGEDAAVAAHLSLLEANGRTVARFESSNLDLVRMDPVSRAAATVWNRRAYRDLRAFLAREKPCAAHFHNTFPLLSPAVYAAARRERVPIIQSLHNYRLLCPNALLFRSGRPCEDCLHKSLKWPSVVHACYRSSRPATAVTAGMLAVHDINGTWAQSVDVYIALTEFARGKFIEGGLPADRIVVNPNFLAVDPGRGDHAGGFALFVGRLSPEKGIGTLLDAWRLAGGAGRTLKIAGTGPLDVTLDRSMPGVEWLGQLSRDHVLALMRDAAFLVFPSECYEGFPVTLAEAFATGLPVVASNHGAMAEIVESGKTGRLFAPRDARDLADALDWAFVHPRELEDLGAAARAEYESKYTAARSYERLSSIYMKVEQTAAS